MKLESTKLERLPISIIDGDRGVNYPKKNEFFDSEFCLFLNTGNVTLTGFEFANMQFISKQKDEILRKGKLSRFDVILTTRGTLGNVGFYSNKIEFENIRINSGMVVLRSNDLSRVFPHYLYYTIRDRHFQEQIANARSGSAQPQLPIGTLKTLKITLPPLPTQQKIASILSAYDDLIENNLKRIKLLEETAQNIYKEWFVNFRFSGYEKVKFENGLPKGWERKKLAQIYGTSSGGTPSRSKPDFFTGQIKWVKSKELLDCPLLNTEESITEDALKKSSAKLFPQYSVLIAMYGATIGKLGVLLDEATSNQACCAILTKDNDYNHLFIYQFLLNNRTNIINMRMGAAQENISQGILADLEVIIPSRKIIQQYNSIQSVVLQGVVNFHKQNNILREARDILLPRLMNQTIEV